MKALYYTAAELAARGSGGLPQEFSTSSHLIYSSPATLAFNSPGAEGYGVKRAGLAVPESVMLIISPGCCGRNTSAISSLPGYADRFFYLTMDQTDLVTGRHLKKIPKAVGEICRGLADKGKKPRVVMLCITCVDALLGTDMERVCRRAQDKLPGVRVRPCYMYALTREGRKPPMVHVRQSIYALLEPRRKKPSSVNLLGFFSPVETKTNAGSELYPLLRQAGVRTIRQIGSCADYDEFQCMAEANFNLVLHPEARPAAYDLQERLGIPFIELRRFYQIDRIRAQYAALATVLQTTFSFEKWEEEAEEAIRVLRSAYPDAVFSIGEAMNGDPFELACALVREGFAVSEIFGTVTEDNFAWIRILASLSPGTRIYSNLHPSMLHYVPPESGEPSTLHNAPPESGEPSMLHNVPPESGEPSTLHNAPPESGEPSMLKMGECLPGNRTSRSEERVPTITIGRDAGWYHPSLPNVQWNADRQPFGYRAVTGLFTALKKALESGSRGSYAPTVSLHAEPAVSSQEKQKPDSLAEKQKADCLSEKQKADCLSEKRQAGLLLEKCQTASGRIGQAASGRTGQAASGRIGQAASGRIGQAASGRTGQAAYHRAEEFAHEIGSGQMGKKLPAAGPRGFRRFTTPFAPDQSGAVSVLYDMGGICVICDAGGCTGNICGFDEPRWFRTKSAVFSAGLRDMDAILGRDDHLVDKLAKAALQIPADFAAIIGTPVPAVIGTDYRALCRMAEKRTGLPVLGIETDGMEYYDRGMEKAYLALLASACGITGKSTGERTAARAAGREAAPEAEASGPVLGTPATERDPGPEAGGGAGKRERLIGIWGYSPLDFAGILTEDDLRAWCLSQGYDDMICCGAGTDLPLLRRISEAEKNLVLSPAGAAPARRLAQAYGTPWEYAIPENAIPDTERILCPLPEKRILVVHQQVLARRVADLLGEKGFRADAASFFMMQRELLGPQDVQLREESDLRTLVEEKKYDVVIGDRALEPVLAGLPVRLVHLPHFAVSGKTD